MTLVLDTPHLQLIAYEPDDVLALLDTPEHFRESFGFPAADGYGRFLKSDEVSPDWVARIRASTQADPFLHGFGIVDRQTQQVVGSLGFKGGPNEQREVEIAYGIVSAFQNRGYATEAMKAGIEFAFANKAVHRVIAHTRPENDASTRVLEKCGFLRIGDVIDPEDGLVLRWELPRRGPLNE